MYFTSNPVQFSDRICLCSFWFVCTSSDNCKDIFLQLTSDNGKEREKGKQRKAKERNNTVQCYKCVLAGGFGCVRAKVSFCDSLVKANSSSFYTVMCIHITAEMFNSSGGKYKNCNSLALLQSPQKQFLWATCISWARWIFCDGSGVHVLSVTDLRSDIRCGDDDKPSLLTDSSCVQSQ